MSSEEREQEELEVVGEVQGGDPSGAPTTADPESAVLIASYVAEQQHDVTLFERDEATGVHDVYSELRRVSDVAGSAFGMEEGDILSVSKFGAYVESSCIDAWCALLNMFISKKEGSQRNCIILSCPTSQAIFYDFTTNDIDEVAIMANKWARWKTQHLTHLLIPVNLRNVHWCLVVVDLLNMRISCWDSSRGFDAGAYVQSKREILQIFLGHFTSADWGLVAIVFENVPQQLFDDCGVFCIEFARAVTEGCRRAEDLEQHVTHQTIRAARSHITAELQQRQIMPKNRDSNIVAGTRLRKKPKA